MLYDKLVLLESQNGGKRRKPVVTGSNRVAKSPFWRGSIRGKLAPAGGRTGL